MMRAFSPARRLALCLGAAGGIAVALGACRRQARAGYRATDVTGVNFGRDLALVDHHGTPRTMADFRGRVAVVFFSFTRCPDGCPETLTELAQVLRALGADADRVQVLLVTIDPDRDTADVLADYVTRFHPSFLGLRGDAQATERAAKSFRAFYAKVPNRAGGPYTMEHSTDVYVFDPAGNARVVAHADTAPDALVSDIRQLLA